MPRLETIEKGHLYFLFRPRVVERGEQSEPTSARDVQQFYMLLSPHGSGPYRLAVIGREMLPDPARSGKARFWGFIDMVAEDPGEIRESLRAFDYTTKTRGERTQPGARVVGEGVYRLVWFADSTHLVYSLELPRSEGDPQQAFNIEEEASYVITVKNPQTPTPPGAGLSEKQVADYPRRLQEVFRGRKFAECDPPELLDREGAQFVLIAASDDIRAEMGIHSQAKRETRRSADVFTDLRLDKDELPVEPLFEGEWT
jgi:hypothetical protein